MTKDLTEYLKLGDSIEKYLLLFCANYKLVLIFNALLVVN